MISEVCSLQLLWHKQFLCSLIFNHFICFGQCLRIFYSIKFIISMMLQDHPVNTTLFYQFLIIVMLFILNNWYVSHLIRSLSDKVSHFLSALWPKIINKSESEWDMLDLISSDYCGQGSVTCMCIFPDHLPCIVLLWQPGWSVWTAIVHKLCLSVTVSRDSGRMVLVRRLYRVSNIVWCM